MSFLETSFFLLRTLELLVHYENASGRDKVHSLQPQRHKVLPFDWFVNVVGFLFLPCFTPGRTGLNSKEGSLKLRGFTGLAKKPISTAFTAPPERGTRTSVLSKTVLVAFYWFPWSYLLSRDHFQVSSGMGAWKQAVLQVPRLINSHGGHFKGERWAEGRFSSWKKFLFTLHWLNKFLGR